MDSAIFQLSSRRCCIEAPVSLEPGLRAGARYLADALGHVADRDADQDRVCSSSSRLPSRSCAGWALAFYRIGVFGKVSDVPPTDFRTVDCPIFGMIRIPIDDETALDPIRTLAHTAA